MKALVVILLTSFLLLPFSSLKAEIKKDKNKIEYTIKIDQNNTKLARVTMSFIPNDTILHMAPGAGLLQDRWATFVQNMRAIDDEGNILTINKIEGAKWTFTSYKNKRINLTYELILDHEKHAWNGGIDGAAYQTDWGVFYTGRSLFVLHGDKSEEIQVNFELPAIWKVTTPWEATGDRSYRVHNQTALANAMLFAGTHEELSYKRDDFELIFALGGEEVLSEKQDYQKLAEGVLDYYIELMGGIPNPPPNNPLKKSIVIINSGKTTDGEVIGNNISMLVEKGGNVQSKMMSKIVFAHEFFHLWNGKSFRPENDQTEWFKEGFSNYYTLKALCQVGFLEEETYYKTLNSLMYQRYIADKGLGNLSMTRGEEKHDHWGLIYGGGLFVAIAQDMIIREATNNEKSLDDLMKMLYQKFGGTLELYSFWELQEALSSLSGIDQSEFFNTYVIGVKRIPIDIYLSKSSLNTKIVQDNLLITKKEKASELQKKMTLGFLGELN